MKSVMLVVSLGLHGLLYVALPRGQPPPPDERPPEPRAPIEVRFLPGASVSAEVPEPMLAAQPEPEPIADPDPTPASDPEPVPEPTAAPDPAPEPPPPTRSRARARPQPATPASADPSPAAPAGPRRLSMTMSNRSEGGTGGSSGSGNGSSSGTNGGTGSGTGTNPPPSSTAPSTSCSEPLVKPKVQHQVPIEYSRAARAAGLEGQLVLRAEVDAQGTVTRVSVVRSVGAEIDEPAKAAMKTWRFQPATRCGKPVAGRFTIARRFELGD